MPRHYSRKSSKSGSSRSHRKMSNWAHHVRANFKSIYDGYKGQNKHVTRAQHREYFTRTMHELKRSFPADRRHASKKEVGGSRKRYARKPYGSRGKYKVKEGGSRVRSTRKPYVSRGKYKMKKEGSSRKRYSRKPYGSRGKYKPRVPKGEKSKKYRSRRSSAAVGVGAEVAGIGAGVMAGVGGRPQDRSLRRSKSRGSRRESSRGGGLGILGTAAAIVTAPIRALAGEPIIPQVPESRMRAQAPAPKATKAAKKRRAPIVPILPVVAVGGRRRGAGAVAGVGVGGVGAGAGVGVRTRGQEKREGRPKRHAAKK